MNVSGYRLLENFQTLPRRYSGFVSKYEDKKVVPAFSADS
jgi:hypothetical protein